MMDPNHFLMIMLSRFELYQIFSTPDYGKRFSTENTNKVFYVLLQEKICNFALESLSDAVVLRLDRLLIKKQNLSYFDLV